jgi:hypothetical protein
MHQLLVLLLSKQVGSAAGIEFTAAVAAEVVAAAAAAAKD